MEQQETTHNENVEHKDEKSNNDKNHETNQQQQVSINYSFFLC